ncbi:inactive rhomboid protein 1-like [Musa troglodytarum]|uniref:RHOMBOID-like protein n=1 Tax=Musa troglodytarum TaxID=320322 RepID=A0A9E7IFV1_9LILI|nr:inactive rhomboid protein 1-like [Musa troglodytarum]
MGKESASAAAREDEAKLQPWRGDGGDAHPLEIVPPQPVAAPPPARAKPPHLPRLQRDERWWPWLVPTIFVANVAMFVITMYVNDCRKNNSVRPCVLPSLGRFSFEPLKQNPLFGPSAKTSIPHLRSLFSLQVMVSVELTVRASCLVHDKVGICCFVCLFYCVLNHLNDDASSENQINTSLTVRIGPLYVIAGVGGSLLSALFVQSSVSVGASGALFGLLGAMLSELITNWTIYANKFAALISLILIVSINLALGILPHIDNFAHIGGFITGFLLGFVLLIRPQYGYVSQKYNPLGYNGPAKNKHMIYQYVLWVTSAFLLIAGLTVSLILLFRGFDGNDHCSWCHYLSCVPTSKWSCKQGTETCQVLETGNIWNITCQDSGRSQIFINATRSMDDLCNQLCS